MDITNGIPTIEELTASTTESIAARAGGLEEKDLHLMLLRCRDRHAASNIQMAVTFSGSCLASCRRRYIQTLTEYAVMLRACIDRQTPIDATSKTNDLCLVPGSAAKVVVAKTGVSVKEAIAALVQLVRRDMEYPVSKEDIEKQRVNVVSAWAATGGRGQYRNHGSRGYKRVRVI